MADVEIAIGNQSIRFHESRQAESRHAEKGARPRVSTAVLFAVVCMLSRLVCGKNKLGVRNRILS